MTHQQAIETLEYFESNLDEAASAFISWICFFLSRSEQVTGLLHTDYIEALNKVPELLTVCERNAQITWVILFHHILEKRKDGFSLRKVDENLFKNLVEDKHANSIEMIKNARHNVFAHKSKIVITTELPSLEETKLLFRDVFEFFAQMNSKYNRPNLVLSTIFNNHFFAEDFERIITLLNPRRNMDRTVLKKLSIGSYLEI